MIQLGCREDLYPRTAINLHGVSEPRLCEGTGFRLVLFCQGCPRFCPGCRNTREIEIRRNTVRTFPQLLAELAQWRWFRLPSLTSNSELAYEKALWLTVSTQLLWEALHAPFPDATIESAPADLIRMTARLHRRFKYLTSGVREDLADPDWTRLPLAGITIGGGEPLVQAIALRGLVDEIRAAFPGWTVWIYVGVDWEHLHFKDEHRRLVDVVDVVKCGSFTWKKKNRAHFYYGSSDQVAVDVKTSVRSGELQPYIYPEPVVSCLNAYETVVREQRVPRLRPTGAIQALLAMGKAMRTIEDAEAHLGPIDSSLHQRLFEFHPRPKARLLSFRPRAVLNVARAAIDPLNAVEGSTLTVWLQGGLFPPAPDVDPDCLDLIPGRLIAPDTLLQEHCSQEPWRLKSARTGTDAAWLWFNLVLQRAFFRRFGAFGLLERPHPRVDLATYTQAVAAYQGRLQEFFSQAGGGWRLPATAVHLRGGDPTLQVDAVEQLARATREHGLELWVDAPYGWTTLQTLPEGRRLIAAANYVITGKPHQGDPPWGHPFRAHRRQEVRTRDGSLWRPRYAWSQQMLDYEGLRTPEQVVLADAVIRHLTGTAASPRSVEDWEAKVGPLACNWSADTLAK